MRIASTLSFDSVNPSSGYSMTPNGRYLSVTSAQLIHSGGYTCQAVNKAGGSNKKFYVNIKGKTFVKEILEVKISFIF